MQDVAYRAFQSRLMPTVELETIIGVRTPALRKYAKTLDSEKAADFMAALPHTYYEENNLHGMLIERMPDYETVIAALDTFLPYVDNWATCDLISPPVFKKCRPALFGKIKGWLNAGDTYTVRFGLKMLMTHFLEEDYTPAVLPLAASVDTKHEYYLEMMQAWFFATALAKQYADALSYLEERKLAPEVHGKTIQKAVESFRITPEQKEYLKTLKGR